MQYIRQKSIRMKARKNCVETNLFKFLKIYFQFRCFQNCGINLENISIGIKLFKHVLRMIFLTNFKQKKMSEFFENLKETCQDNVKSQQKSVFSGSSHDEYISV